MTQNENQLPSADEWIQNPIVDNIHDTKNSIDNPQDINTNNDIESEKSEIKRDIISENEDTNFPLSFKVV